MILFIIIIHNTIVAGQSRKAKYKLSSAVLKTKKAALQVIGLINHIQ